MVFSGEERRRWRAGPLGLAASLAFVVGMASCSDSVEVAPEIDRLVTPEAGPPPSDAAPYYDVPACNTCIDKTCAAERVRCFSVAGCVAIANCAARVNCNQECLYRCMFNQVGFGRREYQALSTCEFEATCGPCKDTCNRSDLCVLRSTPTAGPAPAPSAPKTCGQCTRERCADAVTKCEPGTPCAAYFACTNPCLEPRDKCVEACNESNAIGRIDAQALLDCTNNACSAQCVY